MKRFRPETTTPRLLYAGDDDLDRAAVYLSTILYASGYGFDFIPSTDQCSASAVFSDYALIILSDYPSKNFSSHQLTDLASAVRNGTSLLMIGGWESFAGLNIEYPNTPISGVLPVEMLDRDDRRNFSQGGIVLPRPEAHIFDRLEWEHPPIIGGLNEFLPRATAQVHLEAFPLRISDATLDEDASPDGNGRRAYAEFRMDREGFPLFVSSHVGLGFGAALAVDLAPHWVGGLVDWGSERIRLDCEDRFIEIGSMYLRFVQTLITFCLSKGTSTS